MSCPEEESPTHSSASSPQGPAESNEATSQCSLPQKGQLKCKTGIYVPEKVEHGCYQSPFWVIRCLSASPPPPKSWPADRAARLPGNTSHSEHASALQIRKQPHAVLYSPGRSNLCWYNYETMFRQMNLIIVIKNM